MDCAKGRSRAEGCLGANRVANAIFEPIQTNAIEFLNQAIRTPFFSVSQAGAKLWTACELHFRAKLKEAVHRRPREQGRMGTGQGSALAIQASALAFFFNVFQRTGPRLGQGRDDVQE